MVVDGSAVTDRLVYDAWLNLPYAKGEVAPDPRVSAMFGNAGQYDGGQSMAEVVSGMDELGIDYAVLSKTPRDITPPFVAGIRGGEHVLHETGAQLARAAADHPGRFTLAMAVDPRLGYEAAQHARIAHEQYGVTVFRILPMFTGLPIDDKLAYPLYTALCDLGLTVTVNVGVPGPFKPAALQRTILVDEVALCFPDLKIVMSHVGDPWLGETIAMLNKHPNVFLMTAGWAPKYVPAELRTFMGSRGRTKVMWASDYPILSMERTLREGGELDVRPEALPGYLGENALAVFGTPGKENAS